LRPGVILGQPMDVMPQGVAAGGRQDAGLPPRAAEPVPDFARLLVAIRVADDQRADRRTEALGQRDRDHVEQIAVLGQRHPGGHMRIPQARAVTAQRHPGPRGELAQPLQCGQRVDSPTAAVVRVLHRDCAGTDHVRLDRTELPGDCVRIE
jgi:hypothetical protein